MVDALITLDNFLIDNAVLPVLSRLHGLPENGQPDTDADAKSPSANCFDFPATRLGDLHHKSQASGANRC